MTFGEQGWSQVKGPCCCFPLLCSAQPLNISVQNLGETQMAEPSKQAKYPKQADTHTLSDKIWFQKDPDSTEWYAESNDMQLLRTNGKSTSTRSGPDVTRESLHFGFCLLPKTNLYKWVIKSGHPGKTLRSLPAVSGDSELCHQGNC